MSCCFPSPSPSTDLSGVLLPPPPCSVLPRGHTSACWQHLATVWPPPGHRRARHHTVVHAVTAPPAHPAQACHVASCVWYSRWTGPPGQGPRSCSATVCGRPPHPVGCSPSRIGLNTVRRFKNSFSGLFNPLNGSKFIEFVENCRNVQKLQTKFHWNSLEQLYTVDFIKHIFVQ
jgi:hypothetical protein